MPWTASEELKARWVEMIISGKNDVARAAGFLALARVAELDTNQQRLLATFYRGYEISEGNLNLFIDLSFNGRKPAAGSLAGIFP